MSAENNMETGNVEPNTRGAPPAARNWTAIFFILGGVVAVGFAFGSWYWRHVTTSETAELRQRAAVETHRGQWAEAISDLSAAARLAPGNLWVCKELVDAEIASGDYPAVERDLLRAERDNPADKNFIKSLRARAALERGDLAAARATAEQVSPGFVANLPFGLLRVRLAMCERDFSRAETALQEIPRDEGGEDLVAALAVCQREIDRCSKRATTAQELLETGRGIILKQLGAKPNDPELLSALALVDAEAGRQDEALESGKKAVELRPVRQDAVIGPFVARRLAQVYALKGDRDSAIEQLGSIASIQGGLTKGDLLNPLWDELRSDPRFDQISRVVAGKVK